MARRTSRSGTCFEHPMTNLLKMADWIETLLVNPFDWRQLPRALWQRLVALTRYLCRNWDLTGAVLCTAALLILGFQLFRERPWETAVPKDLPGFFTGGYYTDF